MELPVARITLQMVFGGLGVDGSLVAGSGGLGGGGALSPLKVRRA